MMEDIERLTAEAVEIECEHMIPGGGATFKWTERTPRMNSSKEMRKRVDLAFTMPLDTLSPVTIAPASAFAMVHSNILRGGRDWNGYQVLSYQLIQQMRGPISTTLPRAANSDEPPDGRQSARTAARPDLSGTRFRGHEEGQRRCGFTKAIQDTTKALQIRSHRGAKRRKGDERRKEEEREATSTIGAQGMTHV
ncbi:hypothetical protein PROFUN_04097 [Planoprotostelium fungivorum]|uniref:Uncharacterized protein n=1 Tax=Planoprotostelium fungivorum TaxID=1890364 RepID=A0A2P6NJH3_9EUKA|nr:hypothetical protein PROFUN_04097 [Planoprotostelium fungivorum]